MYGEFWGSKKNIKKLKKKTNLTIKRGGGPNFPHGLFSGFFLGNDFCVILIMLSPQHDTLLKIGIVEQNVYFQILGFKGLKYF